MFKKVLISKNWLASILKEFSNSSSRTITVLYPRLNNVDDILTSLIHFMIYLPKRADYNKTQILEQFQIAP